MARCGYCNSTVFIGGVKDEDGERYCNQDCQQKGTLLALSYQIPEDQVQSVVRDVHQGLCPVCESSGPVDVSQSYRIWSALLLTSWSTRERICCTSCGRKNQAWDAVFSFVVGWWGIPWGLVMTPVQVFRNISAMTRKSDPYEPSEQLERAVRLSLTAQALEDYEQAEA